jgi:hypothetical protein
MGLILIEFPSKLAWIVVISLRFAAPSPLPFSQPPSQPRRRCPSLVLPDDIVRLNYPAFQDQ